MTWGTFPEVHRPVHRRYVRAYWRYLLGWGAAPDRSAVPPDMGAKLRVLAREEVVRYQASIDADHQAVVFGPDNNYAA